MAFNVFVIRLSKIILDFDLSANISVFKYKELSVIGIGQKLSYRCIPSNIHFSHFNDY